MIEVDGPLIRRINSSPSAGPSNVNSDQTIFVVDDDAAVRNSLRALLETVGLRVQTFALPGEFLEGCVEDMAGCILLDVRMPGMSGLEVQRRLVQRGIRTPVIFITGHGDVATAVSAMKAGAVDYIEKPLREEILLDRVRIALELDERRQASRGQAGEILERLSLLTPRERTVMDLVVSGKSNKLIALELGLSQKTIEVHRAHVMAKLRAESLAELVRFVVEATGKFS